MNRKDKAYIKSLVGSGPPKLSDYDGDGYPDIFDCQPLDPTKDGLIGEAWDRLTGAASQARRAATQRIYRPAISRTRQISSRATAAAQSISMRVAEHRRAGVVRSRALRADIQRDPPKPRADIAKSYKELERRVSERIPTLPAIAIYGEQFGERPAVQRAYQAIGKQVLRLPEPVKAAGVETFKFTRGGYKEFREKPVTLAAHTAAFALAGPVIGAAGRTAVAGRAALAARAPAIAAIPVVGRTAVTTGRAAAPVVAKAAKYALPAMGALWAGSVAQRVHAAPAAMRSETAGRIFMGEVTPMAAGFAAAPVMRAVRPTVATATDFPAAGVERVAKQLYIGKKRMPIGYEKTVSQQLSASSGKTQLAMESEYKATMGQLKYTHTKFARGQIEGDYFLPTPPVRAQIGKISTAPERLMLPSPAPKPTHLYAEISKRYVKSKAVELPGGRPMRWIEAGKRKLEYGVQKPPKYELPDIGAPPGTWGISGRIQIPTWGRSRPSYPKAPTAAEAKSLLSLTPAEAKSLSSLTGAPRPKLLPERLYFQETPISSRYYEPTELLAAMRRPTKPVFAEPTIPVPKPAAKPSIPKPYPEPMAQRAPSPEPTMARPFAEPAAPYETPWAAPKMKRAPVAKAKKTSLPFAEPSPTEFKFPWAEPAPKVAPTTKPATTSFAKPKRVQKPKRAATPYTAPYKFPTPTPTPTPTPSRRTYPLPSVYPYPTPAPYPMPSPAPTPALVVPTRAPKPRPSPRPTPVSRPVLLPPPPTISPKPPGWLVGDDGMEAYRAPRKRAKRDWKQEHELLTLDDFLGYKP